MSETDPSQVILTEEDQIETESLPAINILKYQYKQNNYLSIKWPQATDHPYQEVKNYVMKFARPNDFFAWRAIFATVFYEIISVCLISSDFLSLEILGWVVHSLNTIRLFIQFHDMGHYSFFSNPKLNNFIGVLIGIYVHYPFQAWRNGHNYHHQIFGNISLRDISQTILFTKKQYYSLQRKQKIKTRLTRQPFIFFFITSPLLWFVVLVYAIMVKFGILTSLFLEKVLSFVLYFVIFPLLGLPAGKMFFSMYFVQVVGTGLFHLQHSVNVPYRQQIFNYSFVRAALEGSTFLKIPFFLKPFTNGIEYHHIHHLNTKVPSYKIEQCHRGFVDEEKKQKWDKYNINRVDYITSIKSMVNVMFNEEDKLLEPFSYRHL